MIYPGYFPSTLCSCSPVGMTTQVLQPLDLSDQFGHLDTSCYDHGDLWNRQVDQTLPTIPSNQSRRKPRHPDDPTAMSQTNAVFALVFMLCVVCLPANANWFGKRGDKPDVFSLLLQQRDQRPQPRQPHLSSSGQFLDSIPLGSDRDLDAEAAMVAVEKIVQIWRRQTVDKLQ